MSKDQSTEISNICKEAKDKLQMGEFEKCEEFLCEKLSQYPHSAVPHNLFGLMLETLGNHTLAMKHFRAAWALDPTYLPARYNLEIYGTSFSIGNKHGAFDESDCPPFTEKPVVKRDMTK